jgi:hypothetical protein
MGTASFRIDFWSQLKRPVWVMIVSILFSLVVQSRCIARFSPPNVIQSGAIELRLVEQVTLNQGRRGAL